jgi:enoyl-CoA hydratase
VIEAEAFALCFTTADQKEGIAAFLERRPARFTGD